MMRRVLPPVLGLLFAGLFVSLGFWQLRRLHERQAHNQQIERARAEPPIVLAPDAGAVQPGHQVIARGRYDRDHEIILRGRAWQNAPGIFVVTPLRLEGDTAVLVNRGFVPAPDAVTADVDTLDEPGMLTVRGVAEPIETRSDGGKPITRYNQVTWSALDLTALRERLPYPIFPIVVQQTPDSTLPRLPRRMAPAALDDGPHLSYAIQWFSFALIALVGGAILGWRSR